LSFVIYTEIPDGLDKECKENIADSAGPGSITFDFNLLGSNMEKLFLQTHSHLPKVGDMFIFPAGLPHWVYPFNKTEGERVSISGNIKLKDME
jgi:mannose-6-phosphate isomerase-like protein (cupin superfamily)